MERLLSTALDNLKKADLYREYLEYLHAEWFYTMDDLRLALDDGKSWSDLKLPGRLKLELKKLMMETNSDDYHAVPNEDMVTATWQRCYSEENECYYYYNIQTQEVSWELTEQSIEAMESTKIHEEHHPIEPEPSLTISIESPKSTKTSVLDNLISSLSPTQSQNNNNNNNNNGSEVFMAVVHDEPPPPYEAVAVQFSPSSSPGKSITSSTKSSPSKVDSFIADNVSMKRLMEMGFTRESSFEALKRSNNELVTAIALLTRSNVKNNSNTKKA